MEQKQKLIFAADFGNEKISFAAAKKDEKGTMEIVDFQEFNNSGYINNGIASNGFYKKFDEKIENFAQKNKMEIGGFCFSAAHALRSEILVFPISETNVEELEKCRKQALAIELSNKNRAVFDAHSSGFEGGNELNAKFMILTVKNTVKTDYSREIRKINNVEYRTKYFPAPMVEAEILLSPEQKKEGCLLIDFGAGSTSIALYRGNTPKFCAVAPLGGKHITNDIAKRFGISFDSAENLKKNYGSALKNENLIIPNFENKEIDAEILAETITERLSETLNFLMQEIENQGIIVPSEVVIAGGGSQMKSLPQFLKTYCEANVKFAKIPEPKLTNALLYSLLQKFDKDCAKTETVPVVTTKTGKGKKDEKKGGGFFQRLIPGFKDETEFEQ
ncbi:MAG: pilus assembly protein PilM [Prevotellaceae bacterium]|nr:pilus assembly protein PilM [Prevotellaceae bacterium]